MWLNNMFMDTPIDYEKKCRTRIVLGAVLAVLGVFTLVAVLVAGQVPVLYLERGGRDFSTGYFAGLGGGLTGAGIITVIKNLRILKNPDIRKKREVYETDERNRMMGLRCWAYAGYSMFVLLYIGMVIGGFISKTVVIVLLCVMAGYALLLLVFKWILRKEM